MLPLVISSGAGFGFIALVGGGVTWSRFTAANLPADRAVGAMSQGALIAEGAASLTLYALVGLGAVLFTYLAHRRDLDKSTEASMIRCLIVLVVVESGIVLFFLARDVGLGQKSLAVALIVLAASVTALGVERQKVSGQAATTRRTVCALGPPAVILAFSGLAVLDVRVSMMCLFAAGLAGVCWRVDHLLQGFAWFAVAVFFSVALFGATLEVVQAFKEPQLEPIALIRKGDGRNEGLQGIFVTENADRVYMASVARPSCTDKNLAPDSGRIFWVPRDQVVSYAIGAPQNVERASGAAPEILVDLIASRVPEVENGQERRIRSTSSQGGGRVERAGVSGQSSTSVSPKLTTSSGAGRARPISIAPAVRDEPEIFSLSSTQVRPGQEVTIRGQNFGGKRGRVFVGSQEAIVLGWARKLEPEDARSAIRTSREKGNMEQVQQQRETQARQADTIRFLVPRSATSNSITLSCPNEVRRQVLTVEP